MVVHWVVWIGMRVRRSLGSGVMIHIRRQAVPECRTSPWCREYAGSPLAGKTLNQPNIKPANMRNHWQHRVTHFDISDIKQSTLVAVQPCCGVCGGREWSKCGRILPRSHPPTFSPGKGNLIKSSGSIVNLHKWWQLDIHQVVLL